MQQEEIHEICYRCGFLYNHCVIIQCLHTPLPGLGLNPPPPPPPPPHPSSKLMRCVTCILVKSEAPPPPSVNEMCNINFVEILALILAKFQENEHAKTSLHESAIIEHEERDANQPHIPVWYKSPDFVSAMREAGFHHHAP